MEKLLQIRRRRRSSVLAATVVALLAGVLAIPALASAANTLSLRIKPAVPKEGTPFQIIATGTSEKPNPDAFDNLVQFGFAPGSAACASTAGREAANPNGVAPVRKQVPDGLFDVRATFGGRYVSFPGFGVDSGVVTGRYHACGYLYSGLAARNQLFAATRIEFTVGGTCDSATAKRIRAEKQKSTAQKQLNRAKRSGTSRQVKKAQKKLRKTKARLKMANEDRKALC